MSAISSVKNSKLLPTATNGPQKCHCFVALALQNTVSVANVSTDRRATQTLKSEVQWMLNKVVKYQPDLLVNFISTKLLLWREIQLRRRRTGKGLALTTNREEG